jgi:hypothetical protein
MKAVFIQDCSDITGAGQWIYEGYKRAWEAQGYETIYTRGTSQEIDKYATPEVCNKNEHIFMITDYFYRGLNSFAERKLISKQNLDLLLSSAKRIFLHSQPNSFPAPWGSHNNFVSMCNEKMISHINQQDNIRSWSFMDMENIKDKFFPFWGEVTSIPLAYDNLSYEHIEDDKYKFDVCYVGSRADNGFDEKYKIMVSHFKAFKDSGLKCGFFVGKNLTHEQENKLLYNSKVAINIHDAYQRSLGLDTNERTFKSLGLTGVLVSDKIDHLGKLFPDVKMTNDPQEMVKFVKEYANMSEEQLNSIKEKNRKMIAENHTYNNRIKQMLEL